MGILWHDEVEQHLELLLAGQPPAARFISFIGFGKTGKFANDFFHKRASNRLSHSPHPQSIPNSAGPCQQFA
jgi:hypothetical protein